MAPPSRRHDRPPKPWEIALNPDCPAPTHSPKAARLKGCICGEHVAALADRRARNAEATARRRAELALDAGRPTGRTRKHGAATVLERELRDRPDLACRDENPDLFYLPNAAAKNRAAQEHAAKAVCARCPARAACLQVALERPDPHAVLGGTTPAERRRLTTAPISWSAAERSARDTRVLATPGSATDVARHLGLSARQVERIRRKHRADTPNETSAGEAA